MRNTKLFGLSKQTSRRWMAALMSSMLLFTAACSDREAADRDGVEVTNIVLPTDVVLNLNCANVGVHPETCVLDDPENPFSNTPINEFDINNPEAENKFELAQSIPPGPSGAKARFYFWATALARRPSGENQYYTALALHELFDANSNALEQDELVREQALKAYRSLLDNFFGSVTVFTCCEEISPGGDTPVPFPIPLNERAADHLYRTDSTGFRRLVEGDPLLVESLLLLWGYRYQPANPPDFNDGVVSVITG